MEKDSQINKPVSHPSAEVEEIMGQVPPSIVRYGIALITVVLFIITVFAWYIRYPDMVKGTAVITTVNPPAKVISNIPGKIIAWKVHDSMYVDSGQVLAVVGEGANLEDIQAWHNRVRSLHSAIRGDSLWLIPEKDVAGNLDLSTLQGVASEVTTSLIAYLDLLEKESRFAQPKAEALHRRVLEQDALVRTLEKQIKLLGEEAELVRRDFYRDSLLASKGGISTTELETSRKKVLRHRIEIEEARARLAEVVIRRGDYQQQLTDFLIESESDIRDALGVLEKALGRALGAYAEWERLHIYKSPKAGMISLNQFWKFGQEVNAGDVLMSLMPLEAGNYVARLTLPLKGSGLIEPGSEVKISLRNFPVMEFGVLNGKVARISALPEGEFLLADVELDNGLVTSYNIELSFRGSLSGDVEVITREARLLERIVRPIRFIFEHKIAAQ